MTDTGTNKSEKTALDEIMESISVLMDELKTVKSEMKAMETRLTSEIKSLDARVTSMEIVRREGDREQKRLDKYFPEKPLRKSPYYGSVAPTSGAGIILREPLINYQKD